MALPLDDHRVRAGQEHRGTNGVSHTGEGEEGEKPRKSAGTGQTKGLARAGGDAMSSKPDGRWDDVDPGPEPGDERQEAGHR